MRTITVTIASLPNTVLATGKQCRIFSIQVRNTGAAGTANATWLIRNGANTITYATMNTSNAAGTSYSRTFPQGIHLNGLRVNAGATAPTNEELEIQFTGG